MAIKGLTDKAAAFPSLGVLRKGEKKPDEKRPGKDLTYFRFVSDDPLANEMFMKAYPTEEALRSINVYFPFKTTEENFIDGTWIEKWVASSLVYRSDGETVVLWKTEKGAFSTEPKPDPKPQVLEDGKRADGSCQVGRLTVIVPELGRFATITVLTTSKWDCLKLARQLRSYEALEGDLRGIPFVLKRSLENISTPAGNGKRARRPKWLLSIETLPRYTIAKIAAMERAALPEGAEIIDSNDYTVHGELPSGIVAPFDDDEIEVREAVIPQPETAPTNGNPTNGQAQPATDEAKAYKFPTAKALAFHNKVQDKTGNYYKAGGWHFMQTLKSLGYASWSFLDDADKEEQVLSAMCDHARQAKAEPMAQETLL